jgi:hypothetical protein
MLSGGRREQPLRFQTALKRGACASKRGVTHWHNELARGADDPDSMLTLLVGVRPVSVIVVSAASVSELERLHTRLPAVTVMHKPMRRTEVLQAIATSTVSVG